MPQSVCLAAVAASRSPTAHDWSYDESAPSAMVQAASGNVAQR